MLNDFRALIARTSGTIVEDALGVAALAVILVAALNLPSIL